MYKCSHFIIQELVDKATYDKRGEKAWELLDEKILITIDKLRNRYGPMTINSWKWHGDRMWSGLRTKDSPYYSAYSQHTFGRAVDVIFNDITAEEVRQNILADPDHDDFKYITSFEEGVSWLHIDCRNCERIKTFKP